MEKDKIRERLHQLHRLGEEYMLSDIVEEIESQLKLIDEPLRIMIVGEGKSGKSSLLNALVGKTVAEVDYEPKTWCIGVYATTSGEEYAEVAYKDEIVRTSVEDAKKRMSDYEEEVEEKRGTDEEILTPEIEEIRWHLHIRWPDDGIVIIDTPGFLQGRADTEIVETNVDGAEGVRFVAVDGFEKYYSKSDLVLWCFEATDIGAKDVQEKLESVKNQNKDIYGIVTKLDKLDTDEEREECFRRNNEYYKKYLKECLRSQLPPIRRKDAGEKLERKLHLRQNSVEGIKRCIDWLLRDNKAADLKMKAYEKKCKDIERRVSLYLNSYQRFYYSNMQIHNEAKEKTSKAIVDLTESAKGRIRQILRDESAGFLVGPEYDVLWQQCDEQPQKFVSVLQTRLLNSTFIKNCNDIREELIQNISETISYHDDGLRWSVLSIGAKHGEVSTLETFQFGGIRRNIVFNSFALNLENGFGDKLLDSFLNFFKKGGLVHSLLGNMFGNSRKEKTFYQIKEKFNFEMMSIERQYETQMNEFMYGCINEHNQGLDTAFHRITGIQHTDVTSVLLTIDEKMTDADLYTKNAPYYPYVKDGKTHFIRSEQLHKIDSIKAMTESNEMVSCFKKDYIQKAFSERLRKDEANALKAMIEYNGTKKVERRYALLPEISENEELAVLLPFFNQIDFGKNKKLIEEEYAKELKDYSNRRSEIWNRKGAEALQRVLKSYMLRWDEIWLTPIKQFVERWKTQLENTYRQLTLQRAFYNLPREWDIKAFFQFDQMYNSNYPTLYFMQYLDSGRVNPAMLPDTGFVTPDGRSAAGEVEKNVKTKLGMYENVIKTLKNNYKEKWNREVEIEKDILIDTLTSCYEDMKTKIREDIIPEYVRYLASMNGSKHTKTIREYILDTKKFSKEYNDLIKGKIPVSLTGNSIGYLFADGTGIQESARKYIVKKNKEIDQLIGGTLNYVQ